MKSARQMKSKRFRMLISSRGSAVVLTFLLCLAHSTLWSLEQYVIGGDDGVSWQEIASTEKGAVHLIDFEKDAHSIQPLLTDSTLNLTPGLWDRGGYCYVGHHNFSLLEQQATPIRVMSDGNGKDLESTYVWRSHAAKGSDKAYYFNLGAQFMLASIRFYPRIIEEGDPENFPEGYVFSDKFLTEYQIYINDGSEETKNAWGRPILTLFKEETENLEPYTVVEFDPPRILQWLYMLPGRWLTDWEIAEWEVYGDGYVPSAVYTSGIMDMEALSSWGDIRWEGIGVTDPEARLTIQTRTGSDPDPTVYWRKTGYGDDEIPFDETGRYYTKSDYEKFSVAEKGKVTQDMEHWSSWSAPYPFEEGLEGTPITSPGPRRYIQIRVTFLPSRLDGGRIDWISFEYTQPPVAQNVIAEIWPDQVEPAV